MRASHAERIDTFIALQFLFDRFWKELKVGGWVGGWVACLCAVPPLCRNAHRVGCALLLLLLLLPPLLLPLLLLLLLCFPFCS